MDREFSIDNVKKARDIVTKWINTNLPEYEEKITLGLPEIDDRYDIWRVALIKKDASEEAIGEVKIKKNGEIQSHTDFNLIKKRLTNSNYLFQQKKSINSSLFVPNPIPNKVILGDAVDVLEEFPIDSVQLIITSPPYYNAKPEYCEYIDYQEYLDFLRKVIVRCHTILSEGRFFIINVSPVLIRRTSRKVASKRIPIPFYVHRIMDGAGFEFIDDIIWVKPEGAGWATGRGRRFAADRRPLQYKPVPVTEYVLVYRKKTNKLIDWNIRKHYNKKLVEQSKIVDEYDVTNVWYISPSHNKYHPAVFPDELIYKLIRYYSFKEDMVLDPFAGTGTVGRVALKMERRFLLIDNDAKYFRIIKKTIKDLLNKKPKIRVDFEVIEK